MPTDKTFKVSVTAYDSTPEKLNTFLLQCKTQFEFNEDAFKDVKKRIRFLLSKCEGGTAGPWAATWATDSYITFTSAATNDWPTFRQLVKEHFLPEDVTAATIARMKQLITSTGVTQYVADFASLQSLAGIKDDQVAYIK